MFMIVIGKNLEGSLFEENILIKNLTNSCPSNILLNYS